MNIYSRKFIYYFVCLGLLLPIILSTTTQVFSQTNHIVISEVQISGGTPDDEFVELYNPTDSDIVMTDWKLTRKNSAGTEGNLVANLDGTIPSHGFFLIGHETGYDGSSPLNVNYSAPTNALTNNYTVLLYSDNQITLVDKVGFGTATDPETSTFASNPEDGESIERKAQSSSNSSSMGTGGVDEFLGNGEDTNNNSQDFVLRAVSDPQYSNSTKELIPTPSPTIEPTVSPTIEPSPTNSPEPTSSPTEEPSPTPTPVETVTPTPTATEVPSPTATPTTEPTGSPTEEPSPTPTEEPTNTPTSTPTNEPSPIPTASPSPEPTATPTEVPSPTATPTTEPTSTPTVEPTMTPTATPTMEPSPTATPTLEPTATPESPTPTSEPTVIPTPTSTPLPTFKPKSYIIGIFPFPGNVTVCRITYYPYRMFWHYVYFPRISCGGIY